MPAKLKVRVVAGRNLPVMDRASDLTDAFVEVMLSLNMLNVVHWSENEENDYFTLLNKIHICTFCSFPLSEIIFYPTKSKQSNYFDNFISH